MAETEFIQGTKDDWTQFANAAEIFEAANTSARPGLMRVSATKPAATELQGLPLLFGGVVSRSFDTQYWFRGEITLAVIK